MPVIDAADHADLFVPHAYEEHLADVGEVRLNYAVAGAEDAPPLLLVPGQSESWWGYEDAMAILADHYRVYAVDLRGQGRSTWTPGRYTLDNFGNDLVRFLDLVVQRPAWVSGLSSGGVITAWLGAYAKPGQVLGVVLEDPPLFSSEVNPAVGQSIRQALGPMFRVWNTYLGDQWRIGDLQGMGAAMGREVPECLLRSIPKMVGEPPAPGAGVPQNLKEYDPEWARSFADGTATTGCDHLTLVQQMRCPVLLTHHFHEVDPETGRLLGALSNDQAQAVQRAVEAAGQPFTRRSFPDMPHAMHGADPQGYAAVVHEWISATSESARP